MRLRRVNRLLFSWMAALAVLMAALAPTVSHALAARNGGFSTQVCTPTGTKWVQVNSATSDQAPAPGDLHTLEHCPYCSLHAQAIALPVAGDLALPVRLGCEPPATALAAPPAGLTAWPSAQPRAPPQRS